MANSTTNLDLLSQSQAQKEVTANAMHDATSPSTIFARRATTTSGLTWGFYGGRFAVAGVPTAIANGTIALTASATNYIYTTSAGVVTKVTSAPGGWPGPLASDAVALYEIVTGTASVTSYTDMRSFAMLASSGLPAGGATGEVLTKLSATDGDADWVAPATSFLDISEPVTRPMRMLTVAKMAAVFSNHGFQLNTSSAMTGVVNTNPPTTVFNGTTRVRHRTGNTGGSRVSNCTEVEFGVGDAQGAAFHISGYFGIDEYISTTQVLMGIATAASYLVFGGATEPSALLNLVVVGKDSGDANFQIMHNDGSGACTKIDLGASFPANTSATDWYRWEFWGDASATAVNYKVTNMNTAAVASGTVSTNMPSAGALMGWQSGVGNGVTASFTSIGIGRVTLVTEW